MGADVVSRFVVTGDRARQMRVVPAAVLKRLYMRSNKAGAVQTLAHFFLLVAGAVLIFETMGSWWVVPALVLQAVFINCLFGAMHESVHYGSFRTRWLADVLAFFSGAAILNNAGFYRHYHLAHHRYTQDPKRDPELITSGTPDSWGRWLLAFYAVLLAGSIALHTTFLLWVWLIPLLIGAPLLRLYLLCEHTLCPNSDDGFANTRTTISNPIVRFLMWNLPYHAEHHLFPNIAFYRLPEAHQYLRPHLKFVAKGYVQVNREIIKSFA